MPDQDLILQIIAKDQYSAEMAKARAAVNNMTDAEKEAALAAGQATETQHGFALSFTEINQAAELGKKIIEGLKQVYDFAKEGAAIQRIGEQWDATAATIGVNAQEVVASVMKVTNQTIDDEAIMQIATREITQGVVSNAQQITDFFQIARAMTVRFGGDITENAHAIDMAIETGMSRGLKAKGIITDFAGAYDDLAKKLGVRKTDLTDEEKLQARVNEVMEKGEALVKKVGDTSKDAATQFERLETAGKELGDSLHVAFAQVVTPAVEGANEAIDVLNETLTNKQADAFAASVQNMRTSVIAGTMSLKDYNDGVMGMADAMYHGDDAMKVQIATQFALTTEQYKGLRMLKEYDDGIDTAVLSTQRWTGSIKEIPFSYYTEQVDGAVLATRRWKISEDEAAKSALTLTDSTILITDRTIKYAEENDKLRILQRKLADLNAEIIAQGPAHVGLIRGKTLSEDELSAALAKQAKITEDLTSKVHKKGETDAEFNSRMADLKVQLDNVNASLGTQSGVIGGATKEQLKNRDAILDQIKAMQLQDNTARAMEGIKALDKALHDGTLTNEEYSKRMAAWNRVTGLYTQADLDAATAQQILLDKLTDSKVPLSDLTTAITGAHEELNTQYIPAVVDAKNKTDDLGLTAAEKKDTLASLGGAAATAGSQMNIAAGAARNLQERIAALHDKTITITTVIHEQHIGGSSPLPGGAQHGANFIVPPGYPNDTYPLRVSSGERVIVLTKEQQQRTENHFSMTVNTSSAASPIREFGLMQAMAGAI